MVKKDLLDRLMDGFDKIPLIRPTILIIIISVIITSIYFKDRSFFWIVAGTLLILPLFLFVRLLQIPPVYLRIVHRVATRGNRDRRRAIDRNHEEILRMIETKEGKGQNKVNPERQE